MVEALRSTCVSKAAGARFEFYLTDGFDGYTVFEQPPEKSMRILIRILTGGACRGDRLFGRLLGRWC